MLLTPRLTDDDILIIDSSSDDDLLIIDSSSDDENDVNESIEKNEILENEDQVIICQRKIQNLENELLEKNEKINDQKEQIKNLEDRLYSVDRERQRKIQNLENELVEKNEKINEQKDMIQNLKEHLYSVDKERRKLLDRIQELKGNIRVFCRVRPNTVDNKKKTRTSPCLINCIDNYTLNIGEADSDCIKFQFDRVFPPSATQADVFSDLSILIQSSLEGYNVCIFNYGKTGSGKTYTMEGVQGHEGIIPRSGRYIFQEIEQFKILGWEYKVEASFLQIYNEVIVDLLDPKEKKHDIRMTDATNTDLYVTNLKTVVVDSPDELHMWLRTAQQNRAVAATEANDKSSRSHSVTRIRFIATHTVNNEICVGNLNLVDLAGSESLKNEGVARTTETKNINKSLFYLGEVISALSKNIHVPFRNSKLTHLLMPSLGGNSKTLMMVNISPFDFNETLNSLEFARKVNSCKTGNIKKSKRTINQ